MLSKTLRGQLAQLLGSGLLRRWWSRPFPGAGVIETISTAEGAAAFTAADAALRQRAHATESIALSMKCLVNECPHTAGPSGYCSEACRLEQARRDAERRRQQETGGSK